MTFLAEGAVDMSTITTAMVTAITSVALVIVDISTTVSAKKVILTPF